MDGDKENHGFIEIDSDTESTFDIMIKAGDDPFKLALMAGIKPREFINFLFTEGIGFDFSTGSLFGASLLLNDGIEKLSRSKYLQKALNLFLLKCETNEVLSKVYESWAISEAKSGRLDKAADKLQLAFQLDPYFKAPDFLNRVFVIDHNTETRKGLKTLIKTIPYTKVVGSWGNFNRAMYRMRELQPNVVIVDTNKQGVSGIEVIQKIGRAVPNTRLVTLSGTTTNELHVKNFFNAGVRGYLVKELDIGLLPFCVEGVKDNMIVCSPSVEPLLRDRSVKIKTISKESIMNKSGDIRDSGKTVKLIRDMVIKNYFLNE